MMDGDEEILDEEVLTDEVGEFGFEEEEKY